MWDAKEAIKERLLSNLRQAWRLTERYGSWGPYHPLGCPCDECEAYRERDSLLWNVQYLAEELEEMGEVVYVCPHLHPALYEQEWVERWGMECDDCGATLVKASRIY